MVVPRDRFRPVKTTSDLLLLQSSLFSERNGRIQSHSHQDLPQISIEGPLSQIQTFSQSFGGPLNLKDLLSLRINGDFYFEEGVTLSGHIIFENTSSEKVRISNTQVYTEGRYSF